MRRNIYNLTLVLLMSCITWPAQGVGQEKRQYVVVPAERALPAIAAQPGCPIQFEDVKLIVYVDGKGGGGPSFRLRNRSTKPIRSVSFAWIRTDGGYFLSAWPRANTSTLVMPDQLVPLNETGEQEEAVPLTDDLAEKFDLRGPMQRIEIFMVVRVVFSDGTTYNAEPLAKALRAHAANLGGYDDDPQ
ncbi:MAG TPA: hypothetical protein VF546_23555 [Pyrinomonadaceae bacterium]|jgi:hypothetical protein